MAINNMPLSDPIRPQSPGGNSIAALSPERGVFASLQDMEVKRDPKSTAIAVGVHILVIGLVAYLIATKTNLIAPTKPVEITLVAPPLPPKAPPKSVVMGGGGGQKRSHPRHQGKSPRIQTRAVEPTQGAAHRRAQDRYPGYRRR